MPTEGEKKLTLTEMKLGLFNSFPLSLFLSGNIIEKKKKIQYWRNYFDSVFFYEQVNSSLTTVSFQRGNAGK